MLQAFRNPLKPTQAMMAAAAVVAAVTLYCLAYTALAGRREPVGESVAWAVVNILPWLAAFELGKRSASIGRCGIILASALALSLLGEMLLEWRADMVAFQLVRRVPALLLTVAALGYSRWLRRRAARAEPLELPLLPSQVEWVAAAGNYVELHGAGRTVLHRAPLSRVEAELASHGFVRVHRSTLVRRDRIARVRPLDIVLHDGTSLRTGNRYRARLRS